MSETQSPISTSGQILCSDVYTAPRMNDEITVWNDGKKVKKRKYCLTMYLHELCPFQT